MKPKIIRACTVPMLVIFVTGMLPELQKRYEVVLLSSPGHEIDKAEEKYGVRGGTCSDGTAENPIATRLILESINGKVLCEPIQKN